jgi:hypothetical protein
VRTFTGFSRDYELTVPAGERPTTYHKGPDKASASLRTRQRYASDIRTNQPLDNFEGFTVSSGSDHAVRHPPPSPPAEKPPSLRQETLDQMFLRPPGALRRPQLHLDLTVAASGDDAQITPSSIGSASSPGARVLSSAGSSRASPVQSRAASPVSAVGSDLPRLRTRKRARSSISVPGTPLEHSEPGEVSFYLLIGAQRSPLIWTIPG